MKIFTALKKVESFLRALGDATWTALAIGATVLRAVGQLLCDLNFVGGLILAVATGATLILPIEPNLRENILLVILTVFLLFALLWFHEKEMGFKIEIRWVLFLLAAGMSEAMILALIGLTVLFAPEGREIIQRNPDQLFKSIGILSLFVGAPTTLLTPLCLGALKEVDTRPDRQACCGF